MSHEYVPEKLKAHRHDGAFTVDIKHSSRAEMFFVMTGIGFFRRAGMVYEMVISRQLTAEIINEALLLLLETKGDDGLLHPERHLVTLTDYSAKHHCRRLRKCERRQPAAAEQEKSPAVAPDMSHG